jgi:hypothetical protein
MPGRPAKRKGSQAPRDRGEGSNVYRQAMSATYQIAEAPQRSGLTATTVRYDEQAWLLTPAGHGPCGRNDGLAGG